MFIPPENDFFDSFYDEKRHFFLSQKQSEQMPVEPFVSCDKAVIVLIVTVNLSSSSDIKKEKLNVRKEANKMALEKAQKLETLYKDIYPSATIVRCIDPSLHKIRKIGRLINQNEKSLYQCVLFHYHATGVPPLSRNKPALWLYYNKKSVTESIGFAEMCDWNRGINVFILEAAGASSAVASWRREKSFMFSTNALASGHSADQNFSVCGRSEKLFIKCMKDPVKTSIKLNLCRGQILQKSQISPAKLFSMPLVLEELQKIFQGVVECVAWMIFAPEEFAEAFKCNDLLSLISTRFLLFQRLCHFGMCRASAMASPPLPFAGDHFFWHTWELFCEQALISCENDLNLDSLCRLSVDFYKKVLVSFNNTLRFENTLQKPLFLPLLHIIIKNPTSPGPLLAKAIELLALFYGQGNWAVILANGFGFHGPLLALFKSFRKECRDELVFIAWRCLCLDRKFGKVLADAGMLKKLCAYVRQTVLNSDRMVIVLIVLAVVFANSDGQMLDEANVFLGMKKNMFSNSKYVRWWTLLMLSKLVEKNPKTLRDCYNRALPSDIVLMLKSPEPEVRAAAVYFSSKFISADETEFPEKEAELFKQVAAVGSVDGSPLVRAETAEAIGQFLEKRHAKSEVELSIRKAKEKNAILDLIKKLCHDSYDFVAFRAVSHYEKIKSQRRISSSVDSPLKNDSIYLKLKKSERFDFFQWSCRIFSATRKTKADPERPKKAENLQFNAKSSALRDCYSKSDYATIQYNTMTFDDAKQDVKKLLFHPFKPFLVGADDHGFVNVWDYKNKTTNIFANWDSKCPKKQKISDMTFLGASSSSLLIASASGVATVWKNVNRPNQQKICSTFKAVDGMNSHRHENAKVICRWLSEGSKILFAGTNGKLRWWDPVSEKAVRSFELPDNDYVTALFASEDNDSKTIVGTNRGRVLTLDSHAFICGRKSGPVVRSEKLFGAAVIKLHANGRRMLAAGLNERVVITDAREYSARNCISVFVKHRAPLQFVAAHDRADIFGCALAGEAVRIFDYSGKELKTLKPLDTLSKSKCTRVTAMAFQREHPVLSVAGRLSKVMLYTNWQLGRTIAAADGAREPSGPAFDY